MGAALGIALACKDPRRVILIVGDGSFQMAAQELSTMLRCDLSITIFLINNKCYAIETILGDGPYNYLQSWNYADLVKIFGGNARAKGYRVATAGQMTSAISHIAGESGVQLIECLLSKDDCSPKMVAWATKISFADKNSASF